MKQQKNSNKNAKDLNSLNSISKKDKRGKMADNGKSEKFVDLLAKFYEKFFVGSADAVMILADIEKNYKEEYESIKDFSNNPEAIDKLMNELPIEKQAILLKLLLKAGKFSRDFINLLNLTEEEKRKLSKNLKEFAEELKKEIKK